MTVHALLTAIEAEGAARLATLAATTQAEAEAILAVAQAEAAERRQAAYEAALQPLAASRARRLHAARLEALRRQQAAQARRQARLLAAVRSRLETARDRPDYPTSLSHLIAEALSLLGAPAAGRPILEIDPRDELLVATILADSALPVTITPRLHCQGGVIVRSEDGRITVDNTLAARLERLEPYLAALLPEPAAHDRL